MVGRFFGELQVGQVIKHETTRTVTEADNVLFSTMSMNPQPMHLDEEFARESQFGQRIVNGVFTLGLTLGISVPELTLGTILATVRLESVEFPNPVFHGDTIRVETEITEKRDSKTRSDVGVVMFEHRAYNQKAILVLKCRRVALQLKEELRKNQATNS